MKLYHYTAIEHIHSIQADGMIKTTESNIGSPIRSWEPYGAHVGPDVVWLTKSERPHTGQGLEGSRYDKTAVRITVEISDAHPWEEWSRKMGMNNKWRRSLEKNMYASLWYVVLRPIPEAEWTDVRILKGT